MTDEDNQSDDFDDDLLDDLDDDLLDEDSPKKKKPIVIFFLLLLLGAGGYFAYTNFYAPPPSIPDMAQAPDPPKKAPVKPKAVASQQTPKPATAKPSAIPATPAKPATAPHVKQPVATPTSPEPPPLRKEEVAEQVRPVVKSVTVAPPSPSPGVAPMSGVYAIQLGTYVYEKSVLAAEAFFIKNGYQPYREKHTANFPDYHVFVGEFQDPEEVREIVTRFFAEDIDVKFKILPGGIYTLSVTSSKNQEEVEELKKDLILKGYPARTATIADNVPVHTLRLGKYNSRDEAQSVLGSLKEKNIEAIILKSN